MLLLLFTSLLQPRPAATLRNDDGYESSAVRTNGVHVFLTSFLIVSAHTDTMCTNSTPVQREGLSFSFFLCRMCRLSGASECGRVYRSFDIFWYVP